MKQGILTAVILICSFSTAYGGEQLKPDVEQWHENIAGTYTGTLLASGYDMPVVTTFYYEDDVLLGEYVMDEDGTMTPGELSDITFAQDNTIICTWTDIYGSGVATFAFVDGCSGFAGFWTAEDSDTGYYWWGSKEDLDMQPVLENQPQETVKPDVNKG